MNGSEFLKAWKKAKPLLLTDTGVSELLRKLPDDPSEPQLKLFAAADRELTKHIANPKIKAEKKAVACLQEIQKEIRDDLAHTQTMRVKAVDLLKKIYAVAMKYHMATEKNKHPTRDVVGSFHGEASSFTRPFDAIISSGRDVLIVPTAFQHEYSGHFETLKTLSKAMLILHDDHASAQPKLDYDAKYPEAWKKFGLEAAKLPAVWAKVTALDY